MRIWSPWPLMLLLMLTPRGARAELVMVESIDYRVAHADRVVVGTVTRLAPYKMSGGYQWRHARLRVEEAIRGPSTTEVDVLIRGQGGDWAPDARLLVFLLDPQRFKRVSPPPFRTPAWMADLGWSGLNDRGHGALILTNKMPTVATRDGQLLRTPDALLTAVRSAARQAAPEPAEGYLVDITYETEAGKALYSGSAVELRVPIDATEIARACRWTTSKNVRQRAQALDVWSVVKSPEAERHLRTFLTDASTAIQTDGTQRTMIWPLRIRAKVALEKRGIKVGPIATHAPMPPPIGKPR